MHRKVVHFINQQPVAIIWASKVKIFGSGAPVGLISTRRQKPDSKTVGESIGRLLRRGLSNEKLLQALLKWYRFVRTHVCNKLCLRVKNYILISIESCLSMFTRRSGQCKENICIYLILKNANDFFVECLRAVKFSKVD